MHVLIVSHHRLFKVREPMRIEGFARALHRRGHQITVLCVADHGRWRTTERVERGIRFILSPDLWTGRLRSGWDPWCAWHRHRVLHRLEFDLVHCFESRPATIHPVLARLRRRPAPLVMDWTDWWGHGGLVVENRPRWYPRLLGGVETYYEEHFRTRAQATTVIARGLAVRAERLGVPSESIYWIPNGCRPEAFPIVSSRLHRAAFHLPADRFIICASALDVHLGMEQGIAAIGSIASQRSDLLLLLTGSAANVLAARAAAMGLEAHVRSLGVVPPADYLKAMSCADAYFVPFPDRVANHGRWPGRINDYLSLGRPVITQPVGEMKRLLEQEPIGLLANSVDDIAAAMVFLRDHPADCAAMGRRARELAETILSWDALAPRIETAYAHAQEVFGTGKELPGSASFRNSSR